MPPEEKVTRKLRAILSADVKGYSLLMFDDEAFTVKTLKSYRALMSEQIEQHTGRVVDAPGDNLLAEFASVVDAVQCAVEIQKILKAKNEDLPIGRRLVGDWGSILTGKTFRRNWARLIQKILNPLFSADFSQLPG